MAALDPNAAGLLAMRAAAARLGIDLVALVAEVGIWVEPGLHHARVSAGNPTGAVRPDVRRARPGSGERAGTVVDGVRLDRNNYAGAAIRSALRAPRAEVAGYQACHVWPDSCYDPRYHTVLANLVLVPAPLVSLTDHEPNVIAALKYRSFELYGWHPVEAEAPSRPERYPTSWPAPRAAVRPRSKPMSLSPERSSVSRPGGAPPGSQVEVMQRLHRASGGNRDVAVRAWVEAVRRGEAERKSNSRGMSEEEYARRLIYNGFRKGWLP